SLQLLRADPSAVVRFDDGQDFASGGKGLAIAFELSARQGLVERAGRSLRAALPGGLRPSPLLVHGGVETRGIKDDSLIAARVFDEVTREAEGIVEFESVLTWQSDFHIAN